MPELQSVKASHFAGTLDLARVLSGLCNPKWFSCHLYEVSLAIKTLTERKVRISEDVLSLYLETVNTRFINYLPFSIFLDFYLASSIVYNLHRTFNGHEQLSSNIMRNVMLCQGREGGWGLHLHDVSRTPSTARLLSIFYDTEYCLLHFRDQIKLGYDWLVNEWQQELDDQGLLFKGGLFLQAISKTARCQKDAQIIGNTIDMLKKHQLDDGAWSYVKPTNPLNILTQTKSVQQTAIIVTGLIDVYRTDKKIYEGSYSSITRGIDYLLETQSSSGFWTQGGNVYNELVTDCLCILTLGKYLDLFDKEGRQ